MTKNYTGNWKGLETPRGRKVYHQCLVFHPDFPQACVQVCCAQWMLAVLLFLLPLPSLQTQLQAQNSSSWARGQDCLLPFAVFPSVSCLLLTLVCGVFSFLLSSLFL